MRTRTPSGLAGERLLVRESLHLDLADTARAGDVADLAGGRRRIPVRVRRVPEVLGVEDLGIFVLFDLLCYGVHQLRGVAVERRALVEEVRALAHVGRVARLGRRAVGRPDHVGGRRLWVTLVARDVEDV